MKFKIVLAAWLALLVIPAAPALAHDGTDDGSAVNDSSQQTETHKKSSNNDSIKTAAKDSVNKKLIACKNREASVNNRLQNIANRGQRQLNTFNTIAERTMKFYSDKKLSVANYEDLSSNVATQKTAAQAAVTKIKNDSVNFKCDGTDPKGSIEAFKADLKSETSALKSYRTSIKNLIVAVKSAASKTETQNENQ